MTTPGDVDHQQEAIEKQLEQHLRQGRVSPMQWRCLGGLCEVCTANISRSVWKLKLARIL